MGEELKGGKSGLSVQWPVVAALALAAGGVVLNNQPLHSPRPPDKAMLRHALLGDQDVEARLWQDPLEAVHNYEREPGAAGRNGAGGTDPHATLEKLADQIVQQAPTGATNLAVFLKFVPGGPYAEDIEVRLRARYAALSALGAKRYVPLDPEHVGFCKIAWPPGMQLATNLTAAPDPESGHKAGDLELLLPFEWFRPDRRAAHPAEAASSPDSILLLWLTHEDFGDFPVRRLEFLVTRLRKAVESARNRRTDAARADDANHVEEPIVSMNFTIFDASLQKMVEAIRSEDPAAQTDAPSSKPLANVTLYSAWSTTADALLVPEPVCLRFLDHCPIAVADEAEPCPGGIWVEPDERTIHRRGSAAALLARHGLRLVNATCTDYDLARALVNELALRGVDLTDPSQCVVLLSEWDTTYGRALPLTFATEVRQRMSRQHLTKDCILDANHLAQALQAKNGPRDAGSAIGALMSPRARELLHAGPTAWEEIPGGLHVFLTRELEAVLQNQKLPLPLTNCLPPSAAPEVQALLGEAAITHDYRELNRMLLSAGLPDGCIAVPHWASLAHFLADNPDDWPENVIRARYLRGVDGLLPGEAMPRKESGKKKAGEATPEDLEQPYGRSQLDYIPRLAAHIREVELDAEHHGRSLKAIGILGSDVYDKLLLLQALRARFPTALFFTTDLDARLYHPTELRTTRNLIVSSSFDLAASGEARGEVPPFRDGYQTGQFLCTLAALSGATGCEEQWLHNIRPRLFEVGLTGPYLLESPRRGDDDSPGTQFYVRRLSGWPDGWTWTWIVLALIACLLILLQNVETPFRLLFPRHAASRAYEMEKALNWTLAIGLLLTGVALYYVIYRDHFSDTGEPFTVLAGISIWPTEMMRLLALGLSAFLLVRATYDLRRNDIELTARFHLAPRDPTVELPLTRRQRLLRFLTELWPGKQGWPSLTVFSWNWDGEKVDARRLWRQYQRLGRPAPRFRRYAAATLVYIGFAKLLCLVFGQPFVPHRGALSLWTDRALMFASVGAMFLLVFFVVDATLLCRRFIELLSRKETVYDPELLKEEARLRGVGEKHLDEWLDIRWIADRTEEVGRLIYYPFIVLVVMMLSHNTFFDRWEWPPSLILVFGILLAYAVYGAVMLRRTADRARHSELERLELKLLTEQSSGQADRAKRIQELVTAIRTTEAGAFAPWSQHPMVRALTLPFGGAGVVGLLDYLGKM